MGEGVGVELSKARRLGLPLAVCFLLGALITIAEPDLQVLAQQVPSIPNQALIFSVAGGVGLFLAVALARPALADQALPRACASFIALAFALTALAPDDFIPVSFDSGGVTTGTGHGAVHHGAGHRHDVAAQRPQLAVGHLRPHRAVQRRLRAGGAAAGHLLLAGRRRAASSDAPRRGGLDEGRGGWRCCRRCPRTRARSPWRSIPDRGDVRAVPARFGGASALAQIAPRRHRPSCTPMPGWCCS